MILLDIDEIFSSTNRCWVCGKKCKSYNTKNLDAPIFSDDIIYILYPEFFSVSSLIGESHNKCLKKFHSDIWKVLNHISEMLIDLARHNYREKCIAIKNYLKKENFIGTRIGIMTSLGIVEEEMKEMDKYPFDAIVSIYSYYYPSKNLPVVNVNKMI